MWLVMASYNGQPGIEEAAAVLKTEGGALDAVEAGIRPVESNAQDDGVGLGGMPNVLSEVELDASIMDGRTLAAGAVGALTGYEHPISVARQVMERSPHVMLVGEGARRFAQETGHATRDLLTPEAQRKWREGMQKFISEQELARIADRRELLPLVDKLQEMQRQHGTVNFLAMDARGDIACGVSTSGWAWKYPGRLGDSPIVGAGGYADNRYGAAACCGYGELAIRAGTARSVVLYMKMGLSVGEACREAMRDLEPLLAVHGGGMSIRAMDRNGQPVAIATAPSDEGYWVMTDRSCAPERRESLVFSVRQ